MARPWALALCDLLTYAEAQGQYAAHFAGFGSGPAGGRLIGARAFVTDFRGSKALKGLQGSGNLPKDATGRCNYAACAAAI